jgi:hypothetical protein
MFMLLSVRAHHLFRAAGRTVSVAEQGRNRVARTNPSPQFVAPIHVLLIAANNAT